MLNSAQKRKLKESLTDPPNSDAGSTLTGETYSELAAELGAGVTERSVRHYAQAIARENPEWKRRPLRKGRPKKQLSSAEALLRDISEYLIQAVSLSEGELYRWLRTATGDQWPQLGKVSFHKLFSPTRQARTYQQLTYADALIDCCCLVLGQALVTSTEIPEDRLREHWLVLWGIDARTAFINFELINLLSPTGPGKRSQGRPKHVQFDTPAQWVTTAQNEFGVRLPGTVLRDFLADCQCRLCLPVSRVFLPYGYGTDWLGENDEHLIITQVMESSINLSLPAECLESILDPEAIRMRLEGYMRCHNKQTARPNYNALRRASKEQVAQVRASQSGSFLAMLLTELPADFIALENFYSNQPQFSVMDMRRRIKVVRLSIQE